MYFELWFLHQELMSLCSSIHKWFNQMILLVSWIVGYSLLFHMNTALICYCVVFLCNCIPFTHLIRT